MRPFIVSTARGKYLAAFEYVRPGHVSKFPFFIALDHVDLTRNPDAACMYLTSSSTLGRLYVLYAAKVVHLLSGAWFGLDKLSTCLEAVPTKTNWYLCWEGYAEM